MKSKATMIAEQIEGDLLVLDGLYEKVRHLPLMYRDEKVENNLPDVLAQTAEAIREIQNSIQRNRRVLELGA